MLLTLLGAMSSRQQKQATVPTTPTSSSDHIASLLRYAQTHYETNPTDALTALLEAIRLNAPDNDAGRQTANAAMDQVRAALGDDIAEHVLDVDTRRQQAIQVTQELLQDESSLLFEQGKQDLLRQTMEDGSSIICTKCSGVVPSERWRQHQEYWCEAIVPDEDE